MTTQKTPTYTQVRNQYESLRKVTRDMAQEQSGLGRVAWNWDEVLKKYRTHPKRFELSIWYRDLTLCGATIGRPTWSGGKLRIDFIEAAPMESPFSGLIVDIMIAAGANYAKAIGATQLRIMGPVNEDVKNREPPRGNTRI